MDLEKVYKEIEEGKDTEYGYVFATMEKFANMAEHMREKEIKEHSTEESINYAKNTPIPVEGRNVNEVVKEIKEYVFKTGLYLQHPRFFSYICPIISPYALAGSVMMSLYNVNGGGAEWDYEGITIEQRMIKWFASFAGFKGDNVIGTFTSGGSLSNFTGIVTGRDAKLKGKDFSKARVYLTEQTHCSDYRDCKLAGFREDQIIKIPVDEKFRMKADKLEEQVKKDIQDGFIPCMVIGSLCSTNTAAIDPFDEIGDICKKYDMWLHVDGAFGATILLSDKLRPLAKGIEKADSLTWDMHKWMMQCYSCSIIIFKDKKWPIQTFDVHHEYLEDAVSENMVAPWDMGLEMSQPLRGIQLWVTLQSVGTRKIVEMIERCVGFAEYMEEKLSKMENIEIVSHATCGTFNFRYYKDGVSLEELNKINQKFSADIIDDGKVYLVTTELNGKKVVRVCIINDFTTKEDIDISIASIEKCVKNINK